MEKTKHYPNDVYRRLPNGRYQRMGMEWTGFPMDGIWLVQDGKRNQSCLIGIKENIPILALNYRLHEIALSKALYDRQKAGPCSICDMARVACDYFAKIAISINAENR